MEDNGVIDIREYLETSGEEKNPGAFAVWGGGEERSRFALPLWRAMYLVGGDWGGIIAFPKAEQADKASPLFILDLRSDPARTEVSSEDLRPLQGKEAPALSCSKYGGLVVVLGEDETHFWFLQVRGSPDVAEPGGKDRETLLFLAGECAGLLFFRELASLSPSFASIP